MHEVSDKLEDRPVEKRLAFSEIPADVQPAPFVGKWTISVPGWEE